MKKAVIRTTDTNVSNYVPFGGEDIDLGEEAIAPTPDYCLLQYATGLPAQSPKLNAQGKYTYDEETGEQIFDNIYYCGFFVEYGKDKELDEAMIAKKFSYIFIRHGKGEIKQHWAIQKPTVFLLAKGIPSSAFTGENGADKAREYGMVYAWPKKSVVHIQVMIRNLLPLYTKPLTFTMKSTQTRDALTVFKRQFKVIAKAREELHKIGKDMSLPLWSFSMTWGPAKKDERRGTEENGRMIFPMIGSVPDGEITAQYLQRHEMPIEYIDLFKECTLKASDWAATKMQQIANGTDQDPWENKAREEEHPF